METRRIDLKGNRSLINNKAHIDEAWQKFSKNNSPYLRDALVPHYVKEENKNVDTNVVFDKDGNKYYCSEGSFFVNDEAVGNVNTQGFKKTDLEGDYLCYDMYVDSDSESVGTIVAYIKENTLFMEIYRPDGSFRTQEYYVYEKDILFARAFATTYSYGYGRDGKAIFIIVYKDEYNVLTADFIELDPGYASPSIVTTSVLWERLVNGTTWTAVDTDTEITNIKCNRARTRAGDFFTLIGKVNSSTKEDSWCFCNFLYGERYSQWGVSGPAKVYPRTNFTFQWVEGTITVNNRWSVNATIVHTRETVTSAPTQEGLSNRDNFKITLSDKAQGNTNAPITVTINYLDYENNPQTLSGTFLATQQEITLSRYITGADAHFFERIPELFNITSVVFSQTINHNLYTRNFSPEEITFISNVQTYGEEEWEWGSEIWFFDVNQYNNQGGPVTLVWDWTTTETFTPPTTQCTMVEDDGTFRSVPVYTYRANNITEYVVSAEAYRIDPEDPEDPDNDRYIILFEPTQMYKNTSTYTYFGSSSYNIGQRYFEVLFALSDSSLAENKIHNFYNNTGLKKEIIGDIGMTNDGTTPYKSGGSFGKLWTTQFGGISPLPGSNWRLLYNYGVVSNISFGNLNEEGTILVDWNTIEDSFYVGYTDKAIVYKDVEGVHKIEIEEIKNNVQILEGNYILINTTSYLNCWDIKTKKFVHFASDYNNRCYTGWQASKYNYFTQSGSWKAAWESNKWDSSATIIACSSGQNVNYAITGKPFTSAIFPPQNLYHVVKNKEFYCFGDNSYIDLYYNLVYHNSIMKNTYKYTDVLLYPDAQYPLSSNNVNYFNIPLLFSLIKTHNNKDLIKAGTMYYPVVYYNETVPIFIYSPLGGLDGASYMFVIQSQFYAVLNGKICAVSYAENVISGVDAIIDVTGMIFIGYLPTFALFYSPKNKCIYSFTGDANLELIEDASEIGTLKNAMYNTFTKTVHVVTDKGICIIGDTIYMIEFPGIKEMFFTKEKTVLETEDKIYHLSFDKLTDEYTVLPLEFETEFFGGVNDSVITIYKWSMRFIKDAVTNGTIKLSTVTLTDKGSETREKIYKLTAKDWDPLTDSFYLQFAPENNKACGHKIKIESDFPLTSLIAQITTDGSLAAAKNSMKI